LIAPAPSLAPSAWRVISARSEKLDVISQAVADYISPFAGGRGCVRDIIEKVMKLQNKWPEY